VFTRTTPTCAYEPPDLITSTCFVNCWLIDANTHVLSPTIATKVNVLKPSIVISELEPNVDIQAIYEYVSASVAMVIVNPYAAEALM